MRELRYAMAVLEHVVRLVAGDRGLDVNQIADLVRRPIAAAKREVVLVQQLPAPVRFGMFKVVNRPNHAVHLAPLVGVTIPDAVERDVDLHAEVGAAPADEARRGPET